MAPTNSLCNTARMKTEENGSEDFIFDLIAGLLEANRGRYHGFHSKFAGGFAVSSLSETYVRQAARKRHPWAGLRKSASARY